jgi:group I intron endonuclease
MGDDVEKICGIYIIENIINKHIYIGSSSDINYRIKCHIRMLKTNRHCNTHLQNAYNKYEEYNFEFKILIICDYDMLLFYEQRFLDMWKPAYNNSGIAGKIEMTKSVCNKVSVANKISLKGNHNALGLVVSDEHRKARSMAMMGNQLRKGCKTSEETKEKLSKVGKGRKMPDTTRNALYASVKGHSKSEETKRKLSESHKGKPGWNKGIPCTEECKRNISNSLMGRPLSDEHRKAISKANKGRIPWNKGHKSYKNIDTVGG